MPTADPARDPSAVERNVRAAQTMYPNSIVKVRRGRVVVVQGDLIRLLRCRNPDEENLDGR